MDLFIFFGFFGIILMNGSAIPQIIKMIKTKSVNDLTLWREVSLLIGCLSYLIYAIHRADPVVITSNIWGTISFMVIIYLIIKHAKRR